VLDKIDMLLYLIEISSVLKKYFL